ncbi:MAG: FtsX-like permease family protein [Pseudomonadota bacterium]|jgi:putative ABC transport system permease protein|nr:MAG: ABC transporter permease [Pseudomonadota bacterium]
MRAALSLGLRTLGREWRSGDLAVLFLALFIAVAALTGVGFLVERIDRAMRLQASEVLAADLRLTSPDAIDATYDGEAARRGMASARVTSMLSVILKDELTQLANVHAVTEGYPLRGTVRVADEPFGQGVPAGGIPAPGEIWPDSRLLAALNANVGDLLSVGEIDLRVTRVLISRPDQGSGFVDLAPSVLINDADVAASGLIRPGSRVRYAALFSGSEGQGAEFARWLEENSKPAEHLRDIAEASPEISNARSRAGRFLLLASLAGVLLCAVAIAMTARRYVKRHLDLAALLKTLGASRATVLTISLAQLACIALAASLAGALAGYFAQQGLLALLEGMVSVDLPAPGWQPVAMGFSTALLLLTGFALPSMLQLSRVPAIRVLRRDIGAPHLGTLLAYGPAVLAVVLLVHWVTGDVLLSAGFLVGLALVLGALALGGWLLVLLAGRLRGGMGAAWRYGAANIARRRSESIVQIVALGLGLSALLLLTIIRGDLIDDWRERLPADAPNYFFVNIPPEDRDAFRELLASKGGEMTRMLPMIRGRMTAINGEPVGERRYLTPRGEGLASREQNLTWAEQIGPDNTVTAGKWFDAGDYGKPLVSVATDLEESIPLKLGDRLTFDVAGETVEVTVASFRRVQWDSLQPNFFLMFPPGLLEGTAGTWMGSARFRPTGPADVAELVRRFPGVSIFDMDDLLAQVRSIIEKAVLAVQAVFLFTLLAGVVVLLAAVQATRDERRYESAILRTLGASRRTVLAGVLAEFAAIGVMAGVVAAAGASTGAFFIARSMLEIPWRPDPLLWIAGALTGAALVCMAGWLACRTALVQSPMQTLRAG